MVLVVFNPVFLLFNIIEYNSRQILNVVLGVFNLKIEEMITIENGLSNLKVFIKYLQFINVLIITSAIIGMVAYYYVIKYIYEMTKVEEEYQNKEFKIGNDNYINEFLIQEKIEDDIMNYESLSRLTPIKGSLRSEMDSIFTRRSSETSVTI